METTRTTEQVANDGQFVEGLEAKIKEWESELPWLEKELIEQALIDVKQGERSNRYLVLEGREKAVKRYLKDAKEKLGMVAERYVGGNGPLKNLINQHLNQLRA
jgi:hypothetical protein